MGTEESLRECAESISDMVDTARRAKGEQFAAVTVAIFECLQVADAITKLGERSATSGTAAATETISFAALSAAARVAGVLGCDESDQAVQLARRMMERRDRIQSAIAGAARRSATDEG